MTLARNQHIAWLARSFGRPDYLPLTASDMDVILSTGELTTRFPGSHLFRDGEAARAAFLIEAGEVNLYRPWAGRKRVLARVGAGSIIGDIAMFGEGVHTTAAQAVDHVRAFRFDRDRLLPELGKHPAICLRWLVAGLQQLEKSQRRIIYLMHKTVLAQVADLLVEEAADGKQIQLSQAAIAMLLGASRQSVNEALGVLRRSGVIETGYRSIVVVDVEALTRTAKQGRIERPG